MDCILETVRARWGFDSLRPLQRQAIEASLAGRDALVVLPTGGGKSLCYQVPALLGGSLTVVVSPLIALIRDQVNALASRGVPAALLNSSLGRDARRRVEESVARGGARILYVSPERFGDAAFRRLLGASDVRAFAVDEAHCISQWGPDFRSAYGRLALLRRDYPGRPVHAFTATATPRVREDREKPGGFERLPDEARPVPSGAGTTIRDKGRSRSVWAELMKRTMGLSGSIVNSPAGRLTTRQDHIPRNRSAEARGAVRAPSYFDFRGYRIDHKASSAPLAMTLHGMARHGMAFAPLDRKEGGRYPRGRIRISPGGATMGRFILSAAAVILALSAGCVAHVDSGHSSGHGRTVVVVGAGHVCFDSCDHFHLDGVWYIETGHRHRSGCGHFISGGRWVVYRDDKPGKGPPPKEKPGKDKDRDKDNGRDHDKNRDKEKGKDKDHDKDKGKDKDHGKDKEKDKNHDKDKDQNKDKDKGKGKGHDKDKD